MQELLCRCEARSCVCLTLSFFLCLVALPASADELAGSEIAIDQENLDDQHDHDHEHAHEHHHQGEHDEIENIVITSSPLAHSAEELAIPVNRLRRGQIVEELGTTIGNTLRNVPAVTSTGFSAGASRPVIRGQDSFRTEVLESSLSTQDVSRLSPDHAVPVNPLTAQHIEVVRGPAVLRYGGGASAGVVNAVTNRVPLRTTGEFVQGELIGLYGSNGNQGDFAGTLDGSMGAGTGDVAWHIDGLYRQSDNYETGAGTTQEGTFTETSSVSAGSSYIHDKGRLGFNYTRFDSDYGIPEEGEPVEIDMRTNRYRFEGDFQNPFEGMRSLTLRGVYSDYRHDERVMGVSGQRFDNGELDLRLEGLHDSWFGMLGAAGLHVRHQDLVASGEAAEFLAPSKTDMFAFYFFEELHLHDVIDLEMGLRVEGNFVEGTPISGVPTSRGFVPVSGSIALVAEPLEGWTLGVTGLAGQRAPSQVELFARGPHEATATFEVGNPTFDPETGYTGEVRLEGRVSRIGFEGATFATWYDDFIYGRLTGVTVDENGNADPTGELDQLFYTARDALFYGAEAVVRIDVWEVFGGQLRNDWQLDFVRARFTEGTGNRNVPRVTPFRWGGWLIYEHERLNGRFGFLRTQAQWYAAEDEFATESFTMLELSLRYRLPFLEDKLPMELGFAATNLLDEEARSAVSFNKDEVLLPGRSFQVSLNVEF